MQTNTMKSEPGGAKTKGCPNKDVCPLFPLFASEASLKLWKTMYCEASFGNCQRFRLKVKGLKPPEDLLPNGSRLSG